MSSPTGRAGMPTASTDFIAAIPKAELHLHIEGTLGPALRVALARRNGLLIPDVDPAAETQGYDYVSLEEFLDIYYRGMDVLRTERDFYDLTATFLRRCRDETIDLCRTLLRSAAPSRSRRGGRSVHGRHPRGGRRGAARLGRCREPHPVREPRPAAWTRLGPCSTSCGRGATGSSASGWIRPNGATRRASSPPCSSAREPKATA